VVVVVSSMKKTIITTLLLFLSIAFVSAVTIYSGESITLELEKPYDYYSIIGNSSEVILNIIQEGNFVTITPSKYSVNDSYEVIFFDIEKEIITVYSGGGGGHSTSYKTKYVDRNITQYVDKEVEVIKEVPGEQIEVEKIVNKIPVWILIIITILACVLILLICYIVVRRFKENE